jgi:hypothetical protein
VGLDRGTVDGLLHRSNSRRISVRPPPVPNLDPLGWSADRHQGINKLRAYCSAAAGSGRYLSLWYCERRHHDEPFSTNSATGITFRYLDANNFWFWKNASTDSGVTIVTQLWKKVGAPTRRSVPLTGGGARRARVVATASINVYGTARRSSRRPTVST